MSHRKGVPALGRRLLTITPVVTLTNRPPAAPTGSLPALTPPPPPLSLLTPFPLPDPSLSPAPPPPSNTPSPSLPTWPSMKEVSQWLPEDVCHWLSEEGMQEYAEALGRCDGAALLRLSESDFLSPPLSLVSGDNGRQLLERLETLRMTRLMQTHQTQTNHHGNGKGHHYANGHVGNGTAKSHHHNGVLLKNGFHHHTAPGSGLINGSEQVHIKIPVPPPDPERFPAEWTKTGQAFLYAVCCFLTTSVVISVVHERVPPKEVSPPLPDKFFDVFDRVEWAFSICEVNGMLLVFLWLVQWTLLKHRSIIGRRFFFIVGTLYLYRCVTMYVTTLPVPGMHFRCSPKLNGQWDAQRHRIMKMVAGGGLTITGSHSMCGDYLYSGHTVMLTLTYLFIKEYSPKRFWVYHWVCWGLSAVGVFCILLAHDHYTVDVVVAYFITTRLFWWYHTMANQAVLKENSQGNLFARVWWYRLFQHFEHNVQGTVPKNYQLPHPLSWRMLPWKQGVKYSKLDTQ